LLAEYEQEGLNLAHPALRRLIGRLAYAEASVAELTEQNQRLEDELQRDRRLKSMLHGDAMTEHLEQLVENHEVVAGALIDLNWFKLVNDGWGHEMGNELLRRLEQVLNARFQRKGDLLLHIPLDEDSEPDDAVKPLDADAIARMGGDEFAVAITIDLNPSKKRTTERRAQKLDKRVEKLHSHLRLAESAWLNDDEQGVRKLLRESPLLGEVELTDEQQEAVIAGLGFSIGIAAYDARPDEQEERIPGRVVVRELARQMDIRMYRDKRERRERLRETHPAIRGLESTR
jgi:GGDEF domain-containing protein